MGAMQNDLNRCTFMYDQSRRCRNPLETPGAPYRYYHARKKEKEKERGKRLTSRALFAWLASHPLDSVTQINHAVNQVFLCIAGDLISTRRADALLRSARLLHKTVPDIFVEHRSSIRRDHVQTKERFQEEIRHLLLVATLQDAAEEGDSPEAGDRPQPERPAGQPPAKESTKAAAARA